jgi:hypothetical protein
MNTNWKSLGWIVTRKLVYYILVVLVTILLGSWSAALMTTANTLTFALGLVLSALIVGGLITVVVREIIYYIKKFNS